MINPEYNPYSAARVMEKNSSEILPQDSLDELIQKYWKKDEPLDDRRFFLSADIDGAISDMQNGTFYQDGMTGFVLGAESKIKPDTTLGLSILSISFRQDKPVIVQIQSFSRNNGKDGKLIDEAIKINKRLRWEKLLIECAEISARDRSFPAMYIQPARQNTWVISGNMTSDMAKMRYDYTAKRMGYREEEDGLFKKYLG